jgi:3D (Asp-Asp-Asp) domain-containing protein
MKTYECYKASELNKSLELKIKSYSQQNKDLDEIVVSQADRLVKLSDYIAENDEKYAEAGKISDNNKKLEGENKLLTEQQQGLIEFIEKKTGLKVAKIERANFEVTMYTNQEGAPPYKGSTASGAVASRGTIAAPSSIPMHTLVMIDDMDEPWVRRGFDVVNEVLDRGGAVKEKIKNGEKYYRIDVWAPSQDAKEGWGLREKKGWLIYVK